MNPSNSSRLLFVYGTLKRGFCNHPFLAGQTFVGPARTVPGFRLFDLGDYPGMVPLPEDRLGVSGEIWAVDELCLSALDYLEGVDEGLYRREPVPLRAPYDTQTVETYIYAHGVDGRREVGSQWVE